MTVPPLRSTQVWPATERAIEAAASILRDGGLVVFPTETVYGLGAAADNPGALRSLFEAKGRPADHPVIVHVAEAAQMEPLATNIPPWARQLAAALWPGPMTLVLMKSRQVSDQVTGGLPSVGVRVPVHPVAQALLRRFAGPLAAPSANRFGRVSPTRAEHAALDLAGRVDLILDGGPCQVGLESTIIDATGAEPVVLRPGAVTPDQIAAVLGGAVGQPGDGAPRVSGSLPSHYAPRARVEIVAAGEQCERAQRLLVDGKRVAVLSPAPLAFADSRIHVLPLPHDEADVARELYGLLRRIDELGCDVALVALPPEEGLGLAIADRLRRAAGPREAVS